MRLASLRTDISKIYLSDVENSSQRDFSSEADGQSLYLKHPTDADFTTLLKAVAPVTVLGTAATPFDTTVANGTKLNVRTSSTSSYVQITVRSSASATAAQVAADLNAAFLNAGIKATARVSGTHVAIDSMAKGPSAYLQLSASSPSTAALQTVLGLSTSASAGVTVSALKAVIYPTPTTADVSSATITGIAGFASLSTAVQAAIVAAVQDRAAPRLVETSLVLRSYVYGVISKLRSAAFRPGGSRIALPAKAAVYVLADDGSSLFVL